jgi:hypothetical protein
VTALAVQKEVGDVMTRALLAAVLLGLAAGPAAAADQVTSMLPCLLLSGHEEAQLADRGISSRILRMRDRTVGVLATTATIADAETFVGAARDITDLKRASFVRGIRRFSNPPVLSDLDPLTLSDRDLTNVGRCELRDCSFKLSAPEIETLRRLRSAGGGSAAALAVALKTVLLDRARSYLAGGLGALPPMANGPRPWRLDDVMLRLQSQSQCVAPDSPIASWLANGPQDGRDVESFLYWSQEFYGAGRPVILLNHVAIWRFADHQAVIVGKQVFASRYLDGGIGITALTADSTTGARRLTYVNLASTDFVGGIFGAFKRSALESRLSGELPEIILKLRSRFERRPS